MQNTTQSSNNTNAQVEIATVDEATGRVLKKSERVRLRIALAKENNEQQEAVIKWTMETIGFNRGLARVYVLGNWAKV